MYCVYLKAERARADSKNDGRRKDEEEEERERERERERGGNRLSVFCQKRETVLRRKDEYYVWQRSTGIDC